MDKSELASRSKVSACGHNGTIKILCGHNGIVLNQRFRQSEVTAQWMPVRFAEKRLAIPLYQFLADIARAP